MGMNNSRFLWQAKEFKIKHQRLIMTLLVFLVIPMSASLILGYQMKADVAISIPTVVMDADGSSFSREYIGIIEKSPYFDIVDRPGTYEEIQQYLYEGKAHVGVIIPADFEADLQAGKKPKILTVYDGSTMAVIVSSKSSMSEILLTVKGDYMAKVFQGKQNVVFNQIKNQVIPIDATTRILYNPTKSFRYFILPGMLAAIVQVAMAITGAERGWENQKKGINFIRHMAVVLQWSLVGACSIGLVMGIQWLFFDMPYKGTIAGGILLTILFSYSITLLGYLMGSFFEERTFCTQISCILVLPTAILGGYTWPVLAMPPGMQALAKILPFTYYGEGIRNLCLKPVGIEHLSMAFYAMFLFISAGLFLLYLVNRWMDRKRKKWGMMAA